MITTHPLPLLDSLAHPTLSGKWLEKAVSADFASLSAELSNAGYIGACAVGLDGIEGYDHADFAAQCRAHGNLIPIAGFNPLRDNSRERMRSLRRMGFRGIKIHPRFSGHTQRLDSLGPALRRAGEAGLAVFYCTYLHCGMANHPLTDPFFSLVAILREAPDTRVILVHGGDVELLRYAELVRFNPNLLLDLSMTLMKYPGSSVDLDLAFLFANFDRRICIGSDWPEYSLRQVRERFEQFASHVPEEKLRNIAYLNLLNFLQVDNEFIPLCPPAN